MLPGHANKRITSVFHHPSSSDAGFDLQCIVCLSSVFCLSSSIMVNLRALNSHPLPGPLGPWAQAMSEHMDIGGLWGPLGSLFWVPFGVPFLGPIWVHITPKGFDEGHPGSQSKRAHFIWDPLGVRWRSKHFLRCKLKALQASCQHTPPLISQLLLVHHRGATSENLSLGVRLSPLFILRKPLDP